MRNHNPVERNLALPPNRKRAIEAMCVSCMGCTKDHLKDGFRKEIRYCSAQRCPLHSFRPYRLFENIPPHLMLIIDASKVRYPSVLLGWLLEFWSVRGPTRPFVPKNCFYEVRRACLQSLPKV